MKSVHHFSFGLSAWKSCFSLFSNTLWGFPGFMGLPRLYGADDGMQAQLGVHILMDGRLAVAESFTLQINSHAAVAVHSVMAVVDLFNPLLGFCFLA